MRCDNDYVSILYFVDEACRIADFSQPGGTYLSPYEENTGHFEGAFLHCENAVPWGCENEHRVFFVGLVGSPPCHGGCGILDQDAHYVEEDCSDAGLPPGARGGSSSEEGKMGGILGGIFACGSAVALAVGVAHYLDRKKNKERRGGGEMSLLSPPGRQSSYSGASVGPDVEMGDTKRPLEV
jgi:hypothetical protein